jgi:zinc protease
VRRIPFLFLLFATSSLAAEPELHVAFERYRLPNGLTVILHEDHRLPQVVVDTWFHVGSKDERPKRTGFAHLFEHLMFMGTNNVPNGGFDTIMEAEGGSNNASTSEDRTNYFDVGPSNLLETFLYLEADRLASLPDAMNKQKVDLQRDVVRNERRQSIENRPYGKVELVVPENLYPLGHPYHHPVIGSHADLIAASVDDVKNFFRGYYVPSNASLVVAGDFDTAEAKRLIDKYFAWMPRKEEPPHTVPAPVELPKSARVTLKDHVQLEQVNLVWHSPAQLQPGDAEWELMAALLGGGKSSRLEKALVYDRKLAQEVKVEQQGNRYAGNFTITATAQPGHRAAELEKAIDEELAKLDGKAPPTVREVERARAFTETHLLQQIQPLFGLADALNEHEFLAGDPGALERGLLSRFAKIGPSDLAWAAHALVSRPRLSVTVVPEEKQ